MTTTVQLPHQFALACKFATIDKQQYTRLRHISEKAQLELITSTRDAYLFVRGTMHLDQDQIRSQSQTMTQTQTAYRPRCSVFTAFQAPDFDFTVSSRLLLRAAQQLQNLAKFATGIPPVYKIRFPDDDARFLSLSGMVPQALYLRDRDCQISSFYTIPAVNESVEFPFVFRPSAEPVFLQIYPLVFAALVESLAVGPKYRIHFKILNPNDADQLKIQLSAPDEAGVTATAETPVASAGRIPWLLYSEKLDAFEEEYSYAALRAIAKLMACCLEGDSVTLLGGIGGELIFRIPISAGERVCGQFVCVLCALVKQNDEIVEQTRNDVLSVHSTTKSKNLTPSDAKISKTQKAARSPAPVLEYSRSASGTVSSIKPRDTAQKPGYFNSDDASMLQSSSG